jgi:hypothetical protein
MPILTEEATSPVEMNTEYCRRSSYAPVRAGCRISAVSTLST